MQQREGSTKYDLPLQRETVMALLIKALTKAQPSKQEKVLWFILSGEEGKLLAHLTHCTDG